MATAEARSHLFQSRVTLLSEGSHRWNQRRGRATCRDGFVNDSASLRGRNLKATTFGGGCLLLQALSATEAHGMANGAMCSWPFAHYAIGQPDSSKRPADVNGTGSQGG